MFFEPSEESQQTDTEDCPPDARVTTALDELDIPYHYLPRSQQFEIHYPLDCDRSQSLYIASQTHWFMGVELRKIFSNALVSDGLFEPRTANLLLRENFERIHGGWSVMHNEDEKEHFAIFSLTAFASLPANHFSTIIECVAMPDRAHFLVMGCKPSSDQRRGIRMLRRFFTLFLPEGIALQR
jgi:hypothetical protein